MGQALPQSAIDLINSGVHAHLATINADGTPQLSMVWSAVEDGEICVASLTPRQKLKNVRRDSRVAVEYEARETDSAGLLHLYLVVRGTGRITEGGGADFLRRIKHRYVGEKKFPRSDDVPQGWIMRIRPESWQGYGPWMEN